MAVVAIAGGAWEENIFPVKLPWLIVGLLSPSCSIPMLPVTGGVGHDPIKVHRRLGTGACGPQAFPRQKSISMSLVLTWTVSNVTVPQC